MKDYLELRTACAQNRLELSDQQIAGIQQYAALLQEWNRSINLVSRRDKDADFLISQILHCLAILFKLDIPRGAKVLDLGTGGGLPGIPLKIARPDLLLTLLDSTQKKINVVQSIIKDMSLDGIEAVWGRAEDVGRDKRFANRFDLVVARAVAPLKDLVRWSVPFLRMAVEHRPPVRRNDGRELIQVSGQTLIALKGGDLEGEVRQAEKDLRVQGISIFDLTLAGSHQLSGEEKKIVLVDLHETKKEN